MHDKKLFVVYIQANNMVVLITIVTLFRVYSYKSNSSADSVYKDNYE